MIDPQCQATKWIKNMEAKKVRPVGLRLLLGLAGGGISPGGLPGALQAAGRMVVV